jgi:hypothetical protein
MKWIRIDEIETTRKTRSFSVRTADHATLLGYINFYPRWRKYSFYPKAETLYETDCFRDIAEFCEKETVRWREAVQGRRAQAPVAESKEK